MIFNMSTFFPTQTREYIYPSDLLTDNLQAVSAYLNERKSQRKERDKLLVGGSSGIKMQFTGIDKGILITPINNDYDDQLVVVMPKIIETTLFGDNDKQDT